MKTEESDALTIEDAVAGPSVSTVADDGATDATDELAALLSNIAPMPKADLRIYSVNERTQESAFLFRLPADVDIADLLETVRDEHGPGLYEIWARKGDKKLAWRRRLRIGGGQTNKLGLPAKAPATSTPTGVDGAISTILESNNKLLQQLIRQQAEPRSGQSSIEMLKELAELKNFFQPPQPTPARDAIAQIKDLLSLRELMRDNEPEENPLAAGLKYLAPLLSRGLQLDGAAPNAAPHAPQGSGRFARALAARAAARRQPETESPEMFAQLVIRQYLPDLLARHAQGADPAQVAELVVDAVLTLPEAAGEQVLDWLEADDAVAKIVAIDARAQPAAEWLELVLDAVFGLLADDEAPADTPAQPGAGADVPRETIHHNGAPGATAVDSGPNTPKPTKGKRAVSAPT